MTAALCTAVGSSGKAALGCGRAVVTKGAWARVLSMCCLFHQEIWGAESGSKQYVHAVADFRLGEFFKSEWSIGSLQSRVSGGCPRSLLLRAAPYRMPLSSPHPTACCTASLIGTPFD